jgi:NADP-dependent 3-hydroxy acid dehydrogenase YdfG
MKNIAWIVGGTSGIGLETAYRLEDEVDEVVAIGRNPDHIASARDRLGRSGTIAQVDLYEWAQVRDLCTKAAESPDHIRLLVNAAGTFVPKPFLDHETADYDKYLALNRSLFFVTQAVARNMKRNGGGVEP